MTENKINILEELKKIESPLRAYSIQLTKNETDALDLFQETTFRVLKNKDKFKEGTNFRAWCITIMKNLFLNDQRKKKYRRTIIDNSPRLYYINSSRNSIQNTGESQVVFKEISAMVETLPYRFKQPFWMAYRGYKYDEIATELNAPLGTIKSRIYFARMKLQRMFEQIGEEALWSGASA